MEHLISKTLLISRVCEIMANEYKIPVSEAREKIYNSDLINLIEDDETGLYGESAWYAFSIYEQQNKACSK